jgi:hypothetical protein
MVQKFDSAQQLEVWKLINPYLYKKGDYTMIDFEGTHSDYKMHMIFYNVTKSGNIAVGDVYATREGGIPSGIRRRIAQRIHPDTWFISDGTGSLVFKVR